MIRNMCDINEGLKNKKIITKVINKNIMFRNVILNNF